jgi:hypothetical protein
MSEKKYAWRWKALCIWMVLFTAATFYGFKQIRDGRDDTKRKFAAAIYRNCERTNTLLVQLIKPGIQNTAKLDYYKHHPVEKALVLKQIKDALRIASPSACDNLSISSLVHKK